MKKKDFLEILCSYTPQELQEFIQAKGKQKMVNVFAYIPPKNDDTLRKETETDEQHTADNI